MSTRNFYFDESGFTGYNLLDSDQPAFTVASTFMSSVEAEEILKKAFPKYKGAEFKFSNIWKSSNASGLIDLVKNLSSEKDRFFIYGMDKKFIVLVKMIDFLYEPLYRKAGYDFYKDGFCWKFVNFVYYGLNRTPEDRLYDQLTTLYLNFSREPTSESLNFFREELNDLVAMTTDEHIKPFLDRILFVVVNFDEFLDLDTFKGSNELQVTTMIATIAHWRKMFSEDFEVFHDASSNFFRRKELWEKITDNAAPAHLHPLGDGTSVEFPLRVINTHALDSKNNFAIQLCDILAGLTTKILNPNVTGKEGDLLENVLKSGFENFPNIIVRFTNEFPETFLPALQEGPDAVDLMTNIIFGSDEYPLDDFKIS